MSLNVDVSAEEPRPDAGSEGMSARGRNGPGLSTREVAAAAVARYGLLLVFALIVIVFSLARPSTFPTWANATAIFTTAAPGLIVAMGLTMPLVMQEFDLSFAATISLTGGSAMVLMGHTSVPWPLVCLLMLGLGAAVGALNGALTAFLGGSSFVITLAMATVLSGVEFAITNQASIFNGAAAGFTGFGQATWWGIGTQVWVAALLAVVLWVALDRTEMGRYMYAVGGNAEAARLSGLPNRTLKLVGFVVVATAAAVVGLLLTANSGAYTPNFGSSYLLPAFAGAFLGSAVWRPGEFTIPGTVIGVLFLGVVQTGLTMLNLPTYVINLVQGAILITAVLLSRAERRAA